jgi:hypothetical protein
MPLSCQWVGSDAALDVFDEVLFVARFVGCASDQSTMRNVKVTDERQSAMSDIFKFAPFQRLYNGHFIYAFCVLPLLGSFWRLFLSCVDVCNLLIKAILMPQR